MNKEDLSKYQRNRKYLTEEEIKEQDAREVLVSQFVENRIHELHAESGKPMELCRKEIHQEMRDLYTRLDEILFYKWDPLRFSNSNMPRDEYTSYVEEVLQVAIISDAPEAVATHLTYICGTIIGIRPKAERENEAAELIFTIVHDDDYFPDHEVIDID